MVKLNIEALKIGRYNGLEYRKVKSFINKPRKAEEFKKNLEVKMKAKHLAPIVEKVRIGWRLGYVYRVCVPKKVYNEVK